MPQTIFTFTQEKLTKFIAMTLWKFSMPQIENPDFDPDKEVGPDNLEFIDEFTTNQWAKEAWIRHWKQQERRYREHLRQSTDKEVEDNSLVT